MGKDSFLVTEDDFNQWRERKAAQSTSWWSCIDARVAQAVIDQAGSRGAFWPLMVYAAVLRQCRVKQEPAGWVRLTKALLPLDPPLRGRTKAAAVETLEQAQLVEVRRRSSGSAPELRLLHLPAMAQLEPGADA